MKYFDGRKYKNSRRSNVRTYCTDTLDDDFLDYPRAVDERERTYYGTYCTGTEEECPNLRSDLKESTIMYLAVHKPDPYLDSPNDARDNPGHGVDDRGDGIDEDDDWGDKDSLDDRGDPIDCANWDSEDQKWGYDFLDWDSDEID